MLNILQIIPNQIFWKKLNQMEILNFWFGYLLEMKNVPIGLHPLFCFPSVTQIEIYWFLLFLKEDQSPTFLMNESRKTVRLSVGLPCAWACKKYKEENKETILNHEGKGREMPVQSKSPHDCSCPSAWMQEYCSYIETLSWQCWLDAIWIPFNSLLEESF